MPLCHPPEHINEMWGQDKVESKIYRVFKTNEIVCYR